MAVLFVVIDDILQLRWRQGVLFRLGSRGVKGLLTLLFIASLCALWPAHAQEEVPPRDRVYVFKSDRDYPPFEYVQGDQLIGFNAELLQAIARVMELNIRLDWGEWRHVRHEFEAGRIDGLTGLFFSEERSQFAEFSVPHSLVTYSLFVSEENGEITLADLHGGRVVVQEADIMHDYLLESDFSGEIHTTPTPADALRQVALGVGDAALLQRVQGLYLINQLGLDTLMEAPVDVPPHQYCFAVQKGNRWLIDQINEGMRILKATGEYGDIHQRWLGAYDVPDYGVYLRYLREGILGIALIFLGIMGWVYLLRRQVRLRTRALRESEEKYRALFEGSSDAIFIADEHQMLDCNQRACEFLGATREEIRAGGHQQFSASTQPDGSNSMDAAAARIRSALSGEPQLFHWLHHHKDGTIIDAEVSLQAVHVLGKKVYMAAVRDISERKRAEEAIRRERDLVRAIMETSPVGIVMTDEHGGVIFANQQAQRILNLDRNARAEPSEGNGAWHITDFNGKPLREGELPFHRIIDAGRRVHDLRHAVVDADGCQVLLSVSGAPLFEAEHTLRGVVMVFEDITARVEAEQEREKRWGRIKQHQAALVRIAGDASLVEGNLDAAARLIVMEASNVLETDLVSLWLLSERQQRLHCLFMYNRLSGSWETPDDIPIHQAPGYLEAMATGRHIDASDALNDARTSELRELYLRPQNVCALLDAPIRVGGKLVGVLSHEQMGAVRQWHTDEIQFAAELADQAAQAFAARERVHAEQERRALEAQVQHAQKLESLGILAGGIAHDFNNLLMAIIGNAELALMDISPANPARNSVQEIETVARRAADLCRQMLAYSGKGKFVVEPLNLNEIITEIGHMLEISISKRAMMRYNLADALPAVEADVSQMRQILMNLVVNASEALDDRDGIITISTCVVECDRGYLDKTYLSEDLAEGVYVGLEVADTGMGMDANTQNRIFDPFFTTKFTGRGLGLAAVLGIVRGHQGAIKVYSEVGKGTTFKVLLPASDKQAVIHPAEANNGAVWRGSGLLLLVDDEEVLLTVTAKMLRRLGFEVITARDGLEALVLFRERMAEIRCVILDLTMPNMNGEECYREMRRLHERVRVILSSGFNEQDATQRFVGKGLAGFLQKPYRLAAMTAKLREILGE